MKTDDEHIKYYAKERLDAVARVILTFVATLWLMVPVFAFYWVSSKGPIKDVIVLVFTMVFAIFLAIGTKAKRHEIFAATAAYVPQVLFSGFHPYILPLDLLHSFRSSD